MALTVFSICNDWNDPATIGTKAMTAMLMIEANLPAGKAGVLCIINATMFVSLIVFITLPVTSAMVLEFHTPSKKNKIQQ